MITKVFKKKSLLLSLASLVLIGQVGLFGVFKPEKALAVGSVSKKGVASNYYCNNNLTKLSNLNVGWFYNWSTNYSATTSTNMEYVPMVWGRDYVTSSNITALTQGKASGKFKNLLAFNEPDLAGQAAMSVDEAIGYWPQLMNTGLRLGSPAPTTPDNGWLDNFMTQANSKGYRVDFIALHFYPDFTNPNSINDIKTKITNVYNKYKKPIWITELGTVDINAWGIKTSAPVSQQAADSYMQSVVAMLESLPFVERYAWFMDKCPTDPVTKYSSLYDSNDNLTSMGKIYQTVTVNNATFYQDANYGGTSIALPKGNYTMAQLSAAGIPNDWVSSLKVPSGWTVELYENDNFTGTKWAFTANSSYVGATVNDKATSIKIY
ncbi:glycosyl hydrolase [Clostridium yunnanense]|nr:glycosyl hydrolase [Clostridium yunnanense]